jgi:hypothetical protein
VHNIPVASEEIVKKKITKDVDFQKMLKESTEGSFTQQADILNNDLHKELPAEKRPNFTIESKNPKFPGKLEYPNIKPRYKEVRTKVVSKERDSTPEVIPQEQIPKVDFVLKNLFGAGIKLNERSVEYKQSVSIIQNDVSQVKNNAPMNIKGNIYHSYIKKSRELSESYLNHNRKWVKTYLPQTNERATEESEVTS